MLAILVLALGLVSVAQGGKYLTVNNQPTDSITLMAGQSVTIDVVSDDNRFYVAYVGSDDPSIVGSLAHLKTMQEAGDQAGTVQVEYNEPVFC